MGADLEDRFRPPACCAPAVRVRADSWMPAITEAAQAHGYAATVHGSRARDLDLVLIPWVEDAASPSVVVRGIVHALREFVGDDGVYFQMLPGLGPHGRTWALIHLQGRHLTPTPHGSYPHIDISIMPRA